MGQSPSAPLITLATAAAATSATLTDEQTGS